jgi:hypothetical protein
MHLLIPFACSDAPGCTDALQGLRLPHLEALLQRLVLQDTDRAEADSLSPPHERALARLQGLPAAVDGCIAWAALEARQAGLGHDDAAWAWITPARWNIGAHHVEMTDPMALALDEGDSRALLAAMAPYFLEDGIELTYAQPHRWLARGAVFHDLPCAALDRVIGRDIRDATPAAPLLRRLQSEMQMLLYTHPVNEARGARRQPEVNAFWVSGAGILPPDASAAPRAALHVHDALRDAAMRGDWPGWAGQWAELDRSACRQLHEQLAATPGSTLTLCGERASLCFGTAAQPLWRRLQRRWTPLGLSSLQASL